MSTSYQSSMTRRVRHRARTLVALLFGMDLVDIAWSWWLYARVMTAVAADTEHHHSYFNRAAAMSHAGGGGSGFDATALGAAVAGTLGGGGSGGGGSSFAFDTSHLLLAFNIAKIVLFVCAPFIRCNTYHKQQFLHVSDQNWVTMAVALFGSGSFDINNNRPPPPPTTATAGSRRRTRANSYRPGEEDDSDDASDASDHTRRAAIRRIRFIDTTTNSAEATNNTPTASAAALTVRRHASANSGIPNSAAASAAAAAAVRGGAPSIDPNTNVGVLLSAASASHCQLSELDLRLCAINFCSLHVILALVYISALFFELTLVTEYRHLAFHASVYAHMVLVMCICALIGGIFAWAATLSLSGGAWVGPLAAALLADGGAGDNETESVLGLTPLSRALRQLATIARAAEIHSDGHLLSYHAVVSFARKVYGYLDDSDEALGNRTGANAKAGATGGGVSPRKLAPSPNNSSGSGDSSVAQLCVSALCAPPTAPGATLAVDDSSAANGATASGRCGRLNCTGRHCQNGHCQTKRGMCRRDDSDDIVDSASANPHPSNAGDSGGCTTGGVNNRQNACSVTAATGLIGGRPSVDITAATASDSLSLSGAGGSTASGVGAIAALKASVLEAFIHELEVEVRSPFSHYIRLLHRHAAAVRLARHIRAATTELVAVTKDGSETASPPHHSVSAGAAIGIGIGSSPARKRVSMRLRPLLPPELVALIVDYRLDYPHLPAPRAARLLSPLEPAEVYQFDPDSKDA